jgi:hypothetical protein
MYSKSAYPEALSELEAIAKELGGARKLISHTDGFHTTRGLSRSRGVIVVGASSLRQFEQTMQRASGGTIA